MSASTKSLAQKIAVMQVANSGGSVFTKSENSQVWAKTSNPAFNWGISDYKIVTDYTSLLSNPEGTTLNFTDLKTKLDYLERGKNLEDEVSYASKQITNVGDNVKSDISSKIDVDCTSLDKASLGSTKFFETLISAANGDNATINSYVTEIQGIAKKALRDSIVKAANKVVEDTIADYKAALPESDVVLYENNAPTIDELKATVSELAKKVEELYPSTADGTIIELEKNGITLRFWKNLGKENVLQVAYDLEKATIGSSGEYDVTTDSSGNITCSSAEVTMSMLNSAIESCNSNIVTRDDITLSKANTNAKEYDSALKTEILETVDTKIEDAKDDYIQEAMDKAEALDEVFHQEINASVKKLVLDLMYPVGTLYWSSKNISPSQIFGGTWEPIKDKFILAAGDNYTGGSSGGNEKVSLSGNNLPAHSHTVTITTTSSTSGSSSSYPMLYNADANSTDSTTTSAKISVSGGGNSKSTGDSFSIMPPYVVKYCWERTA